MERAVCSWSGGKESALALHEVVEGSAIEVAELVTMTSAASGRTSFHGNRPELIEAQADALGIPLNLVSIGADATGQEYAALMTDVFSAYADRGIERLVLGDVFLEDQDDYREDAMHEVGFKSYCPLLGEDTGDLIERFLDLGFEATTVCVDAALGRAFLGRRVDEAFLDDLPVWVDPAGEEGEYHTFVHDGPLFDRAVEFERGKVVERDVGDMTMLYCDLVPV
ncbi:MAG: diphthine--ammonia ligase [Haloarculaceae archaeon]